MPLSFPLFASLLRLLNSSGKRGHLPTQSPGLNTQPAPSPPPPSLLLPDVMSLNLSGSCCPAGAGVGGDIWEDDLRVIHQDALRSRGFVGSMTRRCKSSTVSFWRIKFTVLSWLFLYGETLKIHKQTEPTGQKVWNSEMLPNCQGPA